MDGLSRTVAEAVSGLRPSDIPDVAMRAAALSLMDGIGVALAGARAGEGVGAFVRLALEGGGREEASVIGTGARVPAAAAAFANGAMSHAIDYEDSIDGLPVHPHAQTLPAVLALAEREDAPGDRLLAALAVGCDVTARLAAVAGDRMGARGWYPPPILGALGAAMGAANLLGLSPDETLDALSLVVSQATASGEVKNSPRSVVRGVRDAFAAQAAVRAVELARLGVTGFERPLEGRYGFFATYTGGAVDASAVLDGLGTRFWGEQVSYKPWPSCRGTHSFVEGALELRRRIDVDDIERVELIGAPVNTMLADPEESKRRPVEAIDAKFSLPFTVASALVHGGIGLASYEQGALREERVLRLVDRIGFVADPDKDSPESMTHGETVIRLTDGRTIRHDVPVPLGNPSRPLGEEALRAKFVDCALVADGGAAPEGAAALSDRVLALGGSRGVRSELGEILGWGAAGASSGEA